MVPDRAPLLRWVLVLFVVVLFLPTFGEIWHAWSTHRYAAHGVFVPLLTVLILWSRRDRLRDHSAPSSGVGLAVLGIALALAAVGHTWQSVVAHVMAVVVAATGLALCLRGFEWTRQAAAPLAFLGFMVPLPREFVAVITLPLQHFIARLASGLLHVLSIPVSREGLLLDLPAASLQVDEGCNGLRFLMVLLIVTTAFGVMHLSTRGRMIVIAAAVPVAVLANVGRVTAIAVAVTVVGPEAGTGIYHDTIGRAIWALAMASILGFGVVLGWNERSADASFVGAHVHPALK